MPVEAPSGLMSQREVLSWMSGPRHYSDLDVFAARLQEWSDTPLPEAVIGTADELHGDGLMEGEEHMLFFVGTMLVQNGQALLWKVIYDAALDAEFSAVPDEGEDEMDFLERLTVKARSGKW